MQATNMVIRWVHSTPKLEADLRKVAEGGEFNYGDDELAELVADLLGSDLNVIGHQYLAVMGVSRKDARQVGRQLEESVGSNWVDAVVWSEVRETLVKEA
jgi:hypothetical protein